MKSFTQIFRFGGLLTLLPFPLLGMPEFPNSLIYEENRLLQTNTCSVKAFGFIKLLTASLYLGEGYGVENYPGDVPVALRLPYERNFKKHQLIASADKVLNELYSNDQLEVINEKLQTINSRYLDVRQGDEYTMVYLPEKGTSLLFDGGDVLTIPGRRFVELYFSIWLGDHPKTKKLRRALLEDSSS